MHKIVRSQAIQLNDRQIQVSFKRLSFTADTSVKCVNLLRSGDGVDDNKDHTIYVS